MEWLIDIIKEWVKDQAYATIAWVQAQDYATKTWVMGAIYALEQWILYQGYLKTSFVDRGDPGAFDYTLVNFTTDGAWHDLDLSAIVPDKAKAVLFTTRMKASGVMWEALFRRRGNVNTFNRTALYTVVVNIWNSQDCVIPLDADRKIEYRFTSASWYNIDLTVKGWWF